MNQMTKKDIRINAMRHPDHYENCGLSMSNLDYVIDKDMEEKLISGPFYGTHYGWNFCGSYVWYEDGMFHEEVWHYKEYIETVSAKSLNELMAIVNERWRWD